MGKNYFFTKVLFFTISFLLMVNMLFAQNQYVLRTLGDRERVTYTDDTYTQILDGATDFTIEAWVYPVSDSMNDNTQSERAYIVSRHGCFYLRLKYNDNGDGVDDKNDWLIQLQIWDDSQSKWVYKNSSYGIVPFDQWSHVAVIRNSSDGKVRYYVNGSEDATHHSCPPIGYDGSSSKDLVISAKSSGGYGSFGGYIDEVRLKNTAENISDLHTSKYDNQYTSDANTAALFHFNEGTGHSTVNSVSGVNATMSGTNNGSDVGFDYWEIISGDHLPLAYEWAGTSSTDWNNTGNWANGAVPDSVNDVAIPGNVTHNPIIKNFLISNDTTAKCNNLRVYFRSSTNRGKLKINKGNALTVFGDLNNESYADGVGISGSNTSGQGNGSLIVKGNISGKGQFYRYFSAYNSGQNDDGWHLISSPFAMSISGSQFEPGTNDDLYQWDESTNTWQNYKQGHFSSFTAGRGYLCAFGTSDTRTFKGNFNNSDVTWNNLSYTTSQGNGWHLLGNPFQSAIVWNSYTGDWNLTNVATTAKKWVETAKQYLDVSTDASVNDSIIPATNGFFVQVTSSTNSLTIPKSARTHNSQYGNFKNKKRSILPYLKLTVTNDANETYDINRVGFRENATENFDPQYDSHKLFGGASAPQLWTVTNDEIYSLNSLPFPTGPYQVQLNFHAGVNTTYHLTAEGLESFDGGYEIFLEDLKTGEIIDLNQQPNYDFDANTDDAYERFVLHFNDITSVNETIKKSQEALIYSYNGKVYISFSNVPEDSFDVEVFNTKGQQVYSERFEPGTVNSFRLKQKTGLYIVRVKTKNGLTVNKIIIR